MVIGNTLGIITNTLALLALNIYFL